MTEEQREELITFCVEAVYGIQGVRVSRGHFEAMNDTELVEEADWLDYLLDK